MLLSAQLLSLTLALSASAAIFPKDTTVKMLDAKGFKKAMKANQTSVVAFVAPWCGHCQRMAPEYSRAALGLYPLVPMYAVDCDEQQNKRLCAEQGVQGFPTVKLFPRGTQMSPITYDAGERTASAFFYWASRRIPNTVTKLYHVEDIPGWVEKTSDKNRVLLLTKEKKVPLLWKVLGNKYQGQLELASHRDRRGKSSVKLGYEAGEKNQAKVLVYAAGSTKPVRFEGILKHDSLSKFFDSVIDGTADLTVANEEAKSEEFVPDEEELEIQRKQEAQRIALAHGGFSDLIDFEKAIKEGHGADFHDTHGFPGMMGDVPYAKKKEPTEEEKKQSAEAIKEEESTTSTGMPETRKAEATSTADKPVATPEVVDPVQVVFSSEETSNPVDAERPKDEL